MQIPSTSCTHPWRFLKLSNIVLELYLKWVGCLFSYFWHWRNLRHRNNFASSLSRSYQCRKYYQKMSKYFLNYSFFLSQIYNRGWIDNRTNILDAHQNFSVLGRTMNNSLSRDMRFPTMWYVRPAMSQISLRIHAV